MTYSVELSRKAAKLLRKLPKRDLRSIQTKLDALTRNSRPRGVVKLAGEENYYRLRAGDYRIIYSVQEAILLILVLKIGHRKEIYKQL